jgi:heterotetrameric sarcosine oxidase gamma subunit
MRSSIRKEVGSVAEVTNEPVARGPFGFPSGPRTVVDGWEVCAVATAADLTVADVSRPAKVVVRAAPDSQTAAGLPRFGERDRCPDGTLRVGSGPGEWLLIGAHHAPPSEVLDVVPGEFVSVVDISGGRALLRLTGDSARDLLAKICAVNLADRVRPDGSALRASVGGLVTDVVRDDVAGRLSFLLHCERSAAQSLLAAILDAGREFGIAFTGDGGSV